MSINNILAATLLASGIVFAGTGLNCNEVDNMQSNEIAHCVEQTDQELNADYKELMARYKELPHLAEALKTTQKAWLKFRDAECDYQISGSASNSKEETYNSCIVKMTIQRNEALEDYLK